MSAFPIIFGVDGTFVWCLLFFSGDLDVVFILYQLIMELGSKWCRRKFETLGEGFFFIVNLPSSHYVGGMESPQFSSLSTGFSECQVHLS